MQNSFINVDPCALPNDSLCIPIVYGCMDPNYIEYDSLANTEDENIEYCEYLVGCQGYNNVFIEVSVNDDSTIYSNFNWSMTNNNYEIPEDDEYFYANGYDEDQAVNNNYCLSDGCYRLDMNGTWGNANIIVRLDSNIILNETMSGGANFEVHYIGFNVDNESCVDSNLVLGCTQSDAENYDSLATFNNGTCEYIQGCMDTTQFNYNPEATMDDGSCEPYVYGCLDSTYLEYDPEANFDYGGNSCVYPYDCEGYESVYLQVSNYENYSTGDVWQLDLEGDNIVDFSGSLGDTNLFCMTEGTCILLTLSDPSNTIWNTESASVVHEDGTVLFSSGNVSSTETFSVCYGEIEDGGVGGCTFSYASNYDPLATFNNGTCEYFDCQGQDYTEYADIWIGDTYCDDGTWDFFFNCEYFNYDEGDCETPSELGLELQGILDLSLSGSNGKAIHLKVHGEIEDLSIYSIGVANNGGGSDGEEYFLPGIGASDGDDILLARNTQAMSVYFESCIGKFEHLIQVGGGIDQNGDDAIELYKNGTVIETFGLADVDGTGTTWEYTDSWAFKLETWTFGGINCTDGIVSNEVSPCPYPLCEVPITGCTNPSASNYNSDANIDDGTCIINSVTGCMNSNALNYDPEANVNSGCIFPIYGCLDIIAINYDTLANTPDGSCEYIEGCTNQIAPNYDPTATQDDGSCAFTNIDEVNEIYTCGTLLYDSGGPESSYGNNEYYSVTIYPENPGEYVSIYFSSFELETCCDYLTIYDGEFVSDSTLLQEESNGTSLNGKTFYASPSNETGALTITFETDASVVRPGFSIEISCVTYGPGCTNPDATNYSSQANIDDGSCIVEGCTDSTAVNYNPDATEDDGTCSNQGCTDSTAVNYNPDAIEDDGTCDFSDAIPGCTDPTASNYDPSANTFDGSCEFNSDVFGCTVDFAQNYNPQANIDDGSCEYIYGCLDYSATNYNPDANYSDGSCYYYSDEVGSPCTVIITEQVYITVSIPYPPFSVEEPVFGAFQDVEYSGAYDCDMNCWYDQSTIETSGQFSCLGEIIIGCNNPFASNYNPSANVIINDDCVISGCSDINALNYDSDATEDDGSCQYVEGCMDDIASNYNPDATADDGSCQYVEGCMDDDALNFNPDATQGDGSCQYVEGCTDPLFVNYNPDALIDDGSCSNDILGCTYSWASNYNSEATIDDGSCDQPTSSGGGDCPEVQMLDIPLNLPQGWSMFGYTCHESLNLLDAFYTISDKITIVKDANGAAYLPEFQFSAIQSLNFSQGYQIKMIETVNDFQFCPSVILND
jgi:hypothetical protein